MNRPSKPLKPPPHPKPLEPMRIREPGLDNKTLIIMAIVFIVVLVSVYFYDPNNFW